MQPSGTHPALSVPVPCSDASRHVQPSLPAPCSAAMCSRSCHSHWPLPLLSLRPPEGIQGASRHVDPPACTHGCPRCWPPPVLPFYYSGVFVDDRVLLSNLFHLRCVSLMRLLVFVRNRSFQVFRLWVELGPGLRIRLFCIISRRFD